MTAVRTRPRTAPTPSDVGLPDEPVTAGQDAPPAEHARARIEAQLRAMIEHHAGTVTGEDPEELHQFRVAIRRIRSLLRNATAFGEQGEQLRAELKWLADLTSPVRDLDVLVERLPDDLAAVVTLPSRAADAITAALSRRNRRKQAALKQALKTERYRRLLAGLADLAATPTHQRNGHQKVVDLREPRRKAHKAAKKARKNDASDEDLHRFRIKVKRLRYAAETALPAAHGHTRKNLRSVVEQAKTLQDILGDHQDAVIAAEIIGEEGVDSGRADVAFLAGRLVERQRLRQAKARAAWPDVWAELNEAAKPLCGA